MGMRRRFAVPAVAALLLIGSACSPIHSAPLPAAPAASSTQRFLPRTELAADLDSMLAMVERVHPNPYTMVSRDSARALRNAIVAQLPDSANRMTAWPSFARLVASLGDGHTDVQLPSEQILGYMGRGGVMFPVRTTMTASGALTVTSYLFGDSLLRRGDEILSINGHRVDSLLHEFANEIGGETERWREQVAAQQFESFLLVNGIRAPYMIEARSSQSGGVRNATLRGIGRDSLVAYNARVAAARTTATPARNFSYRKLSDGVGYMNLFSLGGELGRFREDLDGMMAQLQRDSARALIVDLRSNGGGDSRFGDELLSHLTTRAYRMESVKLWKMSDEYRAHLKSMVRAPLNHLPIEKTFPTGRKLFSGPAGTIVRFEEAPESHEARAPTFSGPVCVLIGPGTFSSAVDLADGIKTYSLATLIGEETGGRPNTFGEVYYFRAPATGFLVGVSSAQFVRANGDTTDRRGVVPDIEIKRTPDGIRAGRDPVIDRARECATPPQLPHI
jgi:C-terminal processing protease CtpA/Prc